MAQTINPNPPTDQIARRLTPTDLEDFWAKWVEKFPNGFDGMTSNQVMGKIVQILFDNPELFIILPLLKDFTGIVADIAVTASVIKGFIQNTDQCICDALNCLTEISNKGQFSREAQYLQFKELLEVLMSIGNHSYVGSAINRQGFALDQFGQGMNSLSSTTVLNRELDTVSAQEALGVCVDIVDVGDLV